MATTCKAVLGRRTFKSWAALCLICVHSLASAFVEVNIAPTDDLTSIKGIGPATAQRIVEARTQQRFTNWQDFILRVKGIGDKRARQFSDNGLRIEGRSFNEPVPTRGSSSDRQRLITFAPRGSEPRTLVDPFQH